MGTYLTGLLKLRRCLFLLTLVYASAGWLYSQSQAGPQTKGAQRAPQEPLRTAQATRVDRAPKLDGTLNDPLWLQATPITDFRQREPFEGHAPTEQTEVRVLYSKREVYFGITCFDSHPKGIFATELRRDVSQELDDYFEIIIDSSYDRRNAYVFQVNPWHAARRSDYGRAAHGLRRG